MSIPMLNSIFQSSHRIGIFPLQFENQKLGALFVGCPKGCQCSAHGLEIIHLILQACSGAVKRAVNHMEENKKVEVLMLPELVEKAMG